MSPDVQIAQAANLYLRHLFFKEVGDTEQGHSHSFDHLSVLAAGRVKVWADYGVTEYVAPATVLIPAGVEHKIEALEAGSVWLCLHVYRHKDNPEEVVELKHLPTQGHPFCLVAAPILGPKVDITNG
jgi:quercetin dioxygenase-like cupin family protein